MDYVHPFLLILPALWPSANQTPPTPIAAAPGARVQLGTSHFRQPSPISAMAVSPDGKILATGSSWSTYEFADRFSKHSVSVHDNRVYLWDAATGKMLRALQAIDPIHHLAFSPDGQILAGVCAHHIIWWNVGTGTTLQTMPPEPSNLVKGRAEFNLMWRAHHFLSFVQEGKKLLTSTLLGEVYFVDLKTKNKQEVWHIPELQRMASSYRKLHESARSWNELPATAHAVTLSSDGKRFAFRQYRAGKAKSKKQAGEEDILIFDMDHRKQLTSIAVATTTREGRLVFSSDGKQLILATDRIFLFHIDKGKCVRISPPLGQLTKAPYHVPITNVCLSRDDRFLITGQRCGQLICWNLTTGKKQWQVMSPADGRAHWQLQSLPDGRTLAAACGKTIRLFDITTGRERVRPRGHRYTIRQTAFTSDNRTLITLGIEKLCRWDVATGKLMSAHRHHLFPTRQMQSFVARDNLWKNDTQPPRCPETEPLLINAISLRGKLLATMGPKRQVQLRDLVSQRVLRILNTSFAASKAWFSTDGKILAISSEKQKRLYLYDTTTGKQITQTPELSRTPDKAIFTSKDKLVIDQNKSLLLIDVPTGKIHQRVRFLPTGAKKSKPNLAIPVRFTCSADGHWLAVLTKNPPYPTWDVDSFVFHLVNASTGNEIKRFRFSGPLMRFVTHMTISPDNRLLFLHYALNFEIDVWEIATGTRRGQLKAKGYLQGKGYLHGFSLSQNGSRLAGTVNNTAVLWDLRQTLPSNKIRPLLASVKEVADCWQALGPRDAATADSALWAMVHSPKQSMPFLENHLKPIRAASREQIKQWLKNLDSRRFRIRTHAMRQLEQQQNLVLPALRRALQQKPTLEVHLRLQQLMRKCDPKVPTGILLRQLRALEVLEHVGSRRATKLIRVVANGTTGATLTVEAKACLERLTSRHRNSPDQSLSK